MTRTQLVLDALAVIGAATVCATAAGVVVVVGRWVEDAWQARNAALAGGM